MNFIDKNLSRLSKRFNIDLNYFFNVSFWSLLTLFFDSLFGFVFTILLVKSLSATELGTWFWIYSLVSLMTIITLPAANKVLTKSLVEGYINSFFKITKIRLKMSLIASLLVIPIASFFYLTERNYLLVLCFVLYFPLVAISGYSKFIYLKDDFKLLFTYFIIKASSYYGVSVFLLLNGFGLIYIVIAYFYIQAFMDLVYYLLTIKKIKLEKKTKESSKKKLFQDSLKLTGISSINMISGRVDKLLVPLFLSLQDLAIYGVILLIPNFIKTNLAKLFIPLFSKKFNQYKNIKSFLYKISILIATLYVGIVSILILTMPYYFSLIFSNEYIDYLLLAQLLLFFSVFTVLSEFVRSYFDLTVSLRQLFIIDLVSNILFIVLFILLGLSYGLLGLVISRIIFEIIKFCLVIYFFRRI